MARDRKNEKAAYLFIAPFLAFFAIFKLYPMVYGFLVSFLDRNNTKKLTSTTFVGLDNFAKALSNSTLLSSFVHTLVFSLVYTVLVMAFGFLVAMLFNRDFRGRTAARTMFYMPYVTNLIAVGIVFKYLLNPQKGPVNAIFRAFGMMGPKWLQSPSLALVTTAVIGAWAALAFNVITMLAALQDIPKDLYEVADIEGVTFWQRIRYIVLPMVSPTLFLLLTITIINSFKNYTTIMGLTAGGPGTATRVVSLQIYEDAFTYSKFSIAAAEGLMFTIFIILVNVLVSKGREAWERRIM